MSDNSVRFVLVCFLVATIGRAEEVPASPPPVDRLAAVTQGLANNLDAAALWVDSFFDSGRSSADNLREATGRVTLRSVWVGSDGLKARARLRATLPLGNARSRFSAIVGRGSADELVEDKSANLLVPTDGRKEEWLAGLGYVPPWGNQNRFGLNAGVAISWPLDPYVRATYRRQLVSTEKLLARCAVAAFWRDSEQFGVSTSLDFDWRLSGAFLLRQPNWFKVSGVTEEVEYDSRLQLLQEIRPGRAILYGVGLQGDTGNAVPVTSYGVYLIYRQRLQRQWLTGEIILGGAMKRRDSWSERKAEAIFGLGLEVAFTARRDKKNAPASGSQ